MARKLRVEQEGGIYHVINRGNYRGWVFREEGAKQAFERTLFEASERAGWVLHAFCIMGNHFHLAVETPRGNLSEGMRLLQSGFANRFNRLRRESGHLFQGRFKSLLVEDSARLAWLCHYIHLNPVRAGICPVTELRGYRWSSYWYMHEPKRRPKFLSVEACLDGAGGLADSVAGRRRYGEYLCWLSEDEPAKKQMEFARMSRGWVVGSEAFRRAAVRKEKQQRKGLKLSQQEARQARQLEWEQRLLECLQAAEIAPGQIAKEPKSAPWKIAIAALLKQRAMCTNAWLAERLNMGVSFAVSRYVGEMHAGDRPTAKELFERLTAKVKH